MKEVVRIIPTTALVKPNLFEKLPEILPVIRQEFSIILAKQMFFSLVKVKNFYPEHQSKDWFPEYSSYMMEGPIYVMMLKSILKPEDSIQKWREMVINLRTFYGEPFERNGFHGSQDMESSIRESKIVFPKEWNQLLKPFFD